MKGLNRENREFAQNLYSFKYPLASDFAAFRDFRGWFVAPVLV
ncbi:hypothetical protein Hhel01_03788 [Haloferula helveola]